MKKTIVLLCVFIAIVWFFAFIFDVSVDISYHLCDNSVPRDMNLVSLGARSFAALSVISLMSALGYFRFMSNAEKKETLETLVMIPATPFIFAGGFVFFFFSIVFGYSTPECLMTYLREFAEIAKNLYFPKELRPF